MTRLAPKARRGRTLSFAELFGFASASAVAAATAEDEHHEEDEARAEDEEHDEEEDREDSRRSKKSKKAKKARSEEDEEDDEEADEEDGDAKKGKKAKKAKKARSEEDEDEEEASEEEDEEEDEEERDREASARRRGVRAERSRWTTVLSDPRAVGRGDAACKLLATSNLSAASILDTLEAVPIAGAPASRLTDRMAHYRPANPGGSAPEKPAQSSAQATAERIVAAGKMRRGETA